MDLEEASDIVRNFSGDIDNIHANTEEQANIVEQLKAIKNIFESNDISTLEQVAGLDVVVETDLSVSTYLIEQSKEMFEKIYEESLYIPNESEKIGNTTFNGKNIEVFDAKTNFAMIVKTIAPRIEEDDTKEKWNSLRSQVTENEGLRYKTCTSYMTPENLLKNEEDVILAFSEGLKGCSFEAMYPKDAHSSFYGDGVYTETNGGSSL